MKCEITVLISIRYNIKNTFYEVIMPNNTNILIVRHAEKPDSGAGLTVAGQARAQAYAIYFQNYHLNSRPIKFDYLFAAADSSASHRPRLTIQPLAKAMKLDINDKYKETDNRKIADRILHKSKYNDSNILICWHHEEILALAKALGVDSSKLPPESHWPERSWPNEVFGWLLQLCYDEKGEIITSRTICTNTELMHDDYGKNPPGVK